MRSKLDDLVGHCQAVPNLARVQYSSPNTPSSRPRGRLRPVLTAFFLSGSLAAITVRAPRRSHGEQRVVPASRRGETHPHVFSYPDSASRGMRARTRRRRPAPPTARSGWRSGARPSSRASAVDREDRGAPHRSYVRRLSTFLPRLRRCSTACSAWRASTNGQTSTGGSARAPFLRRSRY